MQTTLIVLLALILIGVLWADYCLFLGWRERRAAKRRTADYWREFSNRPKTPSTSGATS